LFSVYCLAYLSRYHIDYLLYYTRASARINVYTSIGRNAYFSGKLEKSIFPEKLQGTVLILYD
jgi:hypothetical protein